VNIFLKPRLELIISIFILVIAVLYVYFSFSIKLPNIVDLLGPRFFPMVLGGIFLLFGVIFFVTEIRQTRLDNQIKLTSQRTIRTLFATLILLSLFVFIIDHLGYFLTSLLFIFSFLKISKFGTWIRCASLAIFLAGILQIVFCVWLSVPLPAPFGWI
jgi:putative tricarboxylic transport membrane protein